MNEWHYISFFFNVFVKLGIIIMLLALKIDVNLCHNE